MSAHPATVIPVQRPTKKRRRSLDRGLLADSTPDGSVDGTIPDRVVLRSGEHRAGKLAARLDLPGWDSL